MRAQSQVMARVEHIAKRWLKGEVFIAFRTMRDKFQVELLL